MKTIAYPEALSRMVTQPYQGGGRNGQASAGILLQLCAAALVRWE